MGASGLKGLCQDPSAPNGKDAVEGRPKGGNGGWTVSVGYVG
jgi:hypothetical protein